MDMSRTLILTTAALLTTSVATLGPASAEEGTPDIIYIQYTEFDHLIDEMSPSSECSGSGCAVGCWWGCCAINNICPAGTHPECWCSWGSPHCSCVTNIETPSNLHVAPDVETHVEPVA